MAKVLIVDDSRIARAVARHALQGAGYSTLEAGSLDEALDVLDQDNHVDLILLDWNMPGGNGLELVYILRSRADTALTPVVFATSEADPRRIGYAQEAGANGYVVKPYTADALLGVLSPLLEGTV